MRNWFAKGFVTLILVAMASLGGGIFNSAHAQTATPNLTCGWNTDAANSTTEYDSFIFVEINVYQTAGGTYCGSVDAYGAATNTQANLGYISVTVSGNGQSRTCTNSSGSTFECTTGTINSNHGVSATTYYNIGFALPQTSTSW